MTAVDKTYLRAVPKVELHCHFEGTVQATTFAWPELDHIDSAGLRSPDEHAS
jgi:hypothetical protein